MDKAEESLKAEPPPVRQDRSRFLNPANLIFALAAIAALVFLVLYSRQNASLRSENDDLRERIAAYGPYLNAKVGDSVPPISSVDIKGNPVAVEYSGRNKHLLLIFTTYCQACLDQLPQWDSLSEKASSQSSGVFAISVDSLEDTKASLNGKYPHLNVLIAPDQNFLRTYRVNTYPQVMIVSNQGVVEWVHTGKLSDAQIGEIMSKLAG